MKRKYAVMTLMMSLALVSSNLVYAEEALLEETVMEDMDLLDAQEGEILDEDMETLMMESYGLVKKIDENSITVEMVDLVFEDEVNEISEEEVPEDIEIENIEEITEEDMEKDAELLEEDFMLEYSFLKTGEEKVFTFADGIIFERETYVEYDAELLEEEEVMEEADLQTEEENPEREEDEIAAATEDSSDEIIPDGAGIYEYEQIELQDIQEGDIIMIYPDEEDVIDYAAVIDFDGEILEAEGIAEE